MQTDALEPNNVLFIDQINHYSIDTILINVRLGTYVQQVRLISDLWQYNYQIFPNQIELWDCLSYQSSSIDQHVVLSGNFERQQLIAAKLIVMTRVVY